MVFVYLVERSSAADLDTGSAPGSSADLDTGLALGSSALVEEHEMVADKKPWEVQVVDEIHEAAPDVEWSQPCSPE